MSLVYDLFRQQSLPAVMRAHGSAVYGGGIK